MSEKFQMSYVESILYPPVCLSISPCHSMSLLSLRAWCVRVTLLPLFDDELFGNSASTFVQQVFAEHQLLGAEPFAECLGGHKMRKEFSLLSSS